MPLYLPHRKQGCDADHQDVAELPHQGFFQDHNPPHVHVVTDDREARMRIDTGEIIAGSLPTNVARNARRWLAANRDFAMDKWCEIAEAE